MTAQQLELLAHEAIARAKGGQQSESSIVELKSEWTNQNDFRKAARQLAGLANAARGQPVIWVVGVDEKTGTVLGAEQTELANWWPQIKSHFDSVAPAMAQNAPFGIDGQTVVALCFDTSSPPYMVNTGHPQVHRDIPWREGNSTRSAFRREVLSLLIPQVTLPKFEIREAQLFYGPSREESQRYVLATRLTIYVAASVDNKLHAPHHNRHVTASYPNSAYPTTTLDLWSSGNQQRLETSVRDDGMQITIEGSGTLKLELSGMTGYSATVPGEVLLKIETEFNEAPDQPLVTNVRFSNPQTGQESVTTIAQRSLFTQIHWDHQRK